MQLHRPLAHIVRTLLLAALFSGCGLKGPLRLPDRAQPVDEAAAQQDSTQRSATQTDGAQ